MVPKLYFQHTSDSKTIGYVKYFGWVKKRTNLRDYHAESGGSDFAHTARRKNFLLLFTCRMHAAHMHVYIRAILRFLPDKGDTLEKWS